MQMPLAELKMILALAGYIKVVYYLYYLFLAFYEPFQ